MSTLTETTYELLSVLAERVAPHMPADDVEYLAKCKAVNDLFKEDRNRLVDLYPYSVEGEPHGWTSFPRPYVLPFPDDFSIFTDGSVFINSAFPVTEMSIRGTEFGIAGLCWYVSVSTPRHTVESDGMNLFGVGAAGLGVYRGVWSG